MENARHRLDLPRRFTFQSLPSSVSFGWGASSERLAPELEDRAAERILVLYAESERSIAENVIAPLRDRVVGTFSEIMPHVPIDAARSARERARECRADWLLSIGGGSTTGLAKAIALEVLLPIAAVPTTYAGSEMTPIWGITSNHRKETGRDVRVQPSLVVYDPALTTSLPTAITVSSAFNALAHCVESFYAPGKNPITALLAEEGVRALATSLRDAGGQAVNREAREGLLYGSFLAGSAFAAAGSGLHHKICHALGGRLDLPHAETHTAVLPQVLAFNEPAMPEVAERIRLALSGEVEDAASGAAVSIFDLIEATGGPVSLAELGMRRAEVAGMVDDILAAVPRDNPRPVCADDVFGILDAAFEGRRPVESRRDSAVGDPSS